MYRANSDSLIAQKRHLFYAHVFILAVNAV
jgi:hypothetical protein